MAELKPLEPIAKAPVQEVKKEAAKPSEKQAEKVEVSNDLLKKVNGEWCFELHFGDKTLMITENKCTQMIPLFRKMTPEQKEVFFIQAAIYGANPLTQEIYPVPFKVDGVDTFIPIVNYRKKVEKGMMNPLFNGCKSGVVVEKQNGSLEYIRGQVRATGDILKGGWCEVFLKGISETIFCSIMLEEFIKVDNHGVPTKFYKEKPSVMCEKIAKSNAFEMAGLVPKAYIEEELAMDIEHEDLSKQKAISANNEEFFNK